MTASEWAAWYGAGVASLALGWNIVRAVIAWFWRGPRLKISVKQTEHHGPDTFVVAITNTKPPAALIESVELRLFVRRFYFLKKEIGHGEAFGLSGGQGFPPNVTIEDAQRWEVNLSRHLVFSPELKSQLPNLNLAMVEIHEAHRRRPYRRYPDAHWFFDWLRSESEKGKSKK